MELEDLKDIWKQHTAVFPLKNEAEIAAMLKGTSRSIVAKLKRSVWFELIFTLIAGVVIVIYAMTLPSGAMKWMSISIPLIFIVYTVYYIKKLILLSRFNPLEGNIRSGIENLINDLSAYLRFYRRSYTVLYPVYFAMGILFGLLEKGTVDILGILSKPKTILMLSVVAVIFYLTSTWVVNWLLKKLYGNHLDNLKSLLHDIHQKHPE